MRPDYQRKKVYNWEREVTTYHEAPEVSHEDATQLVRRVWADYGIVGEPPNLIHRGQVRAYYSSRRACINLPKSWAVKVSIVLHEIAHALADIRSPDKHGPRFMGAFCELLARYWEVGLAANTLACLAEAEGIDVEREWG